MFAYTLSVGVLNNTQTVFLYLLDCAIWENALLLPIGEQALNSAIREADFLCPVREMLFDLIILKFEHLKPVRERRLRCLGIGEEIYNFAARECLLNVLVLEKDHLIAISPDLALDTVWENNLLLATFVEFLAFALCADDLIA